VGSRGRSDADARRGHDDGDKSGKVASAGKRGLFSPDGNAAVSNYPGKIVARLRRALRYPPEARRFAGTAQVSFIVAADGSASGIRLVRSAGSPALDAAALDAVRRASPFPPIPESAARRSWPFSVPLAFARR
jgi:protein TonB